VERSSEKPLDFLPAFDCPTLREQKMAWPKALSPVRVIEELRRKIASIQEQWSGARTENEQLLKEVEELRRERGQLEKDRDRVRGENEELKRRLEQALRADKRQAAPFSRGSRKDKPKRPGRKPGAAYGRHRRKSIPEKVDEVIAVPPPAHCPDPAAAARSGWKKRSSSISRRSCAGPSGADLTFPSAAAPYAISVCRAATRCRHPMPWERQGYSWGPKLRHWAYSSTKV
jgi:hypothetical protein